MGQLWAVSILPVVDIFLNIIKLWKYLCFNQINELTTNVSSVESKGNRFCSKSLWNIWTIPSGLQFTYKYFVLTSFPLKIKRVFHHLQFFFNLATHKLFLVVQTDKHLIIHLIKQLNCISPSLRMLY